jgi:hypothetical protein
LIAATCERPLASKPSRSVVLWALLALLLCTHAGGQGHALSPLPAALVDGCILGLSGLVVASALMSMMDA